MAKFTFKVEGLAECEEALQELPKATNRTVLKRALMNAAEHIAIAARARAPHRTNVLAKSITVGTKLSARQRSQSKKGSDVEVYVGAGPLPRAHLQEFGTAHHGPHPFLRPAVDSQGKAVIDSFVTELKVEIEKARARLARKAERIAAKIAAGK
jgi:HK97 gp10 family phage protein